MSLPALLVDVDNVWQDDDAEIEQKALSNRKAGPNQRLSASEIMTMLIHFHQSNDRNVIETVNDQLKNISRIEHSRHGKATRLAVNLIAELMAYQVQPRKPSVNLSD